MGSAVFKTVFQRQLPFAPNKGEMLTIEIPGIGLITILQKGFMLAPLAIPNLFWFAQNYQWRLTMLIPQKEFYEPGRTTFESLVKVHLS